MRKIELFKTCGQRASSNTHAPLGGIRDESFVIMEKKLTNALSESTMSNSNKQTCEGPNILYRMKNPCSYRCRSSYALEIWDFFSQQLLSKKTEGRHQGYSDNYLLKSPFTIEMRAELFNQKQAAKISSKKDIHLSQVFL